MHKAVILPLGHILKKNQQSQLIIYLLSGDDSPDNHHLYCVQLPLLTLGQKYNSPLQHVNALVLLGQIYETSGEYPKALEATNQALSLSR